MYKKPDIVMFADEQLKKPIATIEFERDVELGTTVRKTVWLYNMGSQKLSNIQLTVNPPDDIRIQSGPHELRPMEKSLVILDWTPKKEYKLTATLDVDGGHPA